MKQFFILLVSSLVVGAILFAVFYWAVNWNFTDSVNVGLSGALGGLVAEYIRIYYEKRKREKALRR